MKIKLVLFIIFISLLSLLNLGCSARSIWSKDYFVAKFDFALSSVERPSDAKERYGEQIINNYTGNDSIGYKYLFEDDMVKILILPSQSGYYFQIYNNTDHSIKIIWDDAVYVDESNVGHRIMHKGTKYTERDNPQPPTVVIRKGMIEDLAAPTDKVYYYQSNASSYFYDSSQWIHLPLLNYFNSDKVIVEEKARPLVGKKLQLLLPLEIQGVTNDYIFEFNILGFNAVKEPILYWVPQ